VAAKGSGKVQFQRRKLPGVSQHGPLCRRVSTTDFPLFLRVLSRSGNARYGKKRDVTVRRAVQEKSHFPIPANVVGRESNSLCFIFTPWSFAMSMSERSRSNRERSLQPAFPPCFRR